MSDIRELETSTAYRVDGFGGLAFRYAGREVERYWDLDEGIDWTEPEERETGRVLMVMVGDDREWPVEPEDCTPIGDDEFCSECGQVGCGWGSSDV